MPGPNIIVFAPEGPAGGAGGGGALGGAGGAGGAAGATGRNPGGAAGGGAIPAGALGGAGGIGGRGGAGGMPGGPPGAPGPPGIGGAIMPPAKIVRPLAALASAPSIIRTVMYDCVPTRIVSPWPSARGAIKRLPAASNEPFVEPRSVNVSDAPSHVSCA
jgi:hypothetical protein